MLLVYDLCGEVQKCSFHELSIMHGGFLVAFELSMFFVSSPLPELL